MSRSIVTKNIAKEIQLIRYVPELQIYEVSIRWNGQSQPTIRHLPEIYLTPFAVKSITSPTVIKIQDDSSSSGQGNIINQLSRATYLEKLRIEPKQESEVSEQAEPLVECILDYNEYIRSQNMQKILIERNLSIVRGRKAGRGKEKRL